MPGAPEDTPVISPWPKDRHTDMLRLATAGSVDDGKSTLIGRLLYDSKAVFEDQYEAVERASAGGDYVNLALLTDGLRDRVRRRADGSTAQGVVHGGHQKYPSFFRSSMAASLTLSSPRVAPRSVIRVTAISAMTCSTVVAPDRTAAVRLASPTVR